MDKYRFIIVGSGWRAGYYIRIAKALPGVFELCGVLCRSHEKAELIKNEYGVNATTCAEDLCLLKPDFVVVCVSKSVGSKVAMEWMDRGFTVLMETPAATDMDTLSLLYKKALEGKKAVVAEQYTRYPQYTAILKLLEKKIIGDVSCVNLSVAHDYHGASLIRAFFGNGTDTGFKLSSKTYSFPTARTLSRYEEFRDGLIESKKRRVATMEFDNGQVAFYDFDSEQYRSPIRKNTLKLQGSLGEIIDNKVYYLDEDNNPRQGTIKIIERIVDRDTDNPNFKRIREIEKIEFEGEVLYTAFFGLSGLTDDETAIARLMKETAEYALG
ncbi:MAG: Gfo/Idh/MocA family oxidoreductase, partial [Butyrivibrio sp.]|nr:Gfo/Idh/MocA family oxidoreductase [Butyrivibrio sp.]